MGIALLEAVAHHEIENEAVQIEEDYSSESSEDEDEGGEDGASDAEETADTAAVFGGKLDGESASKASCGCLCRDCNSSAAAGGERPAMMPLQEGAKVYVRCVLCACIHSFSMLSCGDGLYNRVIQA